MVAGRDRGIVMVLVSTDDLLVPLAALRAAELHVPAAGAVTAGGLEYLSLRSLAPSVTYRLDESSAVLYVDVVNPHLIAGSQTFDLRQQAPNLTAARTDPSGFINYSLTGTNDGSSGASGFVEAGFGNASGHGTATGSYGAGGLRRGLIAYSIDREASLRRETLGDEVGSSGVLGSEVLIGGIGYSRVFELRPDFLRAPSPTLSGAVLSPTHADVYVNGTLYRSLDLAPGQFNLSNLPIAAGANVTRVVLRDSAGETTDVSNSGYGASAVLARGVNEYNYHVGFVRADPFGVVDRYGALAAIGLLRVGVTDAVTAGATFEKGAGRIDGGLTVDARLPFGSVSVAAAASNASGVRGYAARAAYAYVSNRFSFSAYGLSRTSAYSTIALDPSNDRETFVTGESVTYAAAHDVSIGLVHASTRSRDAASSDRIAATLTMRPLRRTTLRFAIERDAGGRLLAAPDGSRTSSWTAGAALTFEGGRSGVASVQTQVSDGHPSTSLELVRDAPQGYGVGYDAQANFGGTGGFIVASSYRSQFFDVNASASFADRRASGSATLSGGIALFERGVFFSEPIQSAYALIKVDGLNDVGVLLNGAEQGNTGRRGGLVIPALSPYAENAVSLRIDGTTNALADVSERLLKPRFNSGVVTSFAVHHVQVFVGTLAVERRRVRFAPSYGVVTMAGPGGAVRSDLGLNGEFYFENLIPGSYRAAATYARGETCTFDLHAAQSASLQVDLGALTCVQR